MHGYRKINLEVVNNLFTTSSKVEFAKVEEQNITNLIRALRDLKEEVKTYYLNDQNLIEKTDYFIKVCRNVVSTLENYSDYIKLHNETLIDYFSFTKKRKYTDLFNGSVSVIVTVLSKLRTVNSNANYDLIINRIVESNYSTEDTYILSKHRHPRDFIEISNKMFKLMTTNEYVIRGIYAKNVIFLGTPNYFDKKFSRIFYGENTLFVGYSCFSNRISLNNNFEGLLNDDEIINTVYKRHTFADMYDGINYKKTFETEIMINKEEMIINNYVKNNEFNFEELKEVQLVKVSNNNYIFVPLNQKINVVDRDTLKIYQDYMHNIKLGDLLIFSYKNVSSLVREEANKIMGKDAQKYRMSIIKWKKRLKYNVNKKGIVKVSKILVNRYGINVAVENNIRNWMSDDSIRPSCLKKLLIALKFDEHERLEIIRAAREISSAHISAGHQISQTLMSELDQNLESIIDENGYYSFKSNQFNGSYFNIEEIQKINSETYLIPLSKVLKIIKR